MSTLMICPTCGGVKTTATGAAVGRRCTCSTGGGVSVSTATASASGFSIKVCCVCRADVTEKKRMKDSATGRYWCYDCYIAEQRKKTANGMTMRCPKCGKDYPPVQMVKHGEAYWCEPCHEGVASKSKKKSSPPAPAAAPTGGIVEVSRSAARGRDAGDDATDRKKPFLIIAAVAMLAAAAVYYFVMMPPS